jgi:hypothetical protein
MRAKFLKSALPYIISTKPCHSIPKFPSAILNEDVGVVAKWKTHGHECREGKGKVGDSVRFQPTCHRIAASGRRKDDSI